jgi:hypothetical protein
MTIETHGRDEAQCQPECRQPKFAPLIATALTLSVSGLPLTGRLPAHATEITFRCVNPASSPIWNLKIDDERQTAELTSRRNHHNTDYVARHCARRFL